MKVLVTGANGQLGRCLKDAGSKYETIEFIYAESNVLNICNLEEVSTFFKTNKNIKYCINCAAYTAVDKAETDKDKAYEVNVVGAKNLAIACNENNAVLIHISTDFVFDGTQTEAYKETDKTNPLSVYGKTKLKGETEIANIFNTYFILRTSWLYSEYGNNFMKTMLRLSETRDEISVVSDQVGTPTYAGDLAEGIVNIINQKITTFGMYHYSNEGVASWFDFAKEIFDLSKKAIKVFPIKTEAYPTPAKRPEFSVMDKSKIKNNLKLEIPYWKTSLKKAIDKL